MVEDGIEAEKAALRKQAHARRESLSPHFRAEASKTISFQFFDKIAFGPEDAIAGYWRIRDEADCQPISRPAAPPMSSLCRFSALTKPARA